LEHRDEQSRPSSASYQYKTYTVQWAKSREERQQEEEEFKANKRQIAISHIAEIVLLIIIAILCCLSFAVAHHESEEINKDREPAFVSAASADSHENQKRNF